MEATRVIGRYDLRASIYLSGFVALFTWIALLAVFGGYRGVYGVSHWIASDEGEIRPQSPSIFALRSPGDLSTIRKQEQRLETVKALRRELLQRKKEIDRCEEEAENTEERLYAEDTDCQAAATPLTELNLHVSTVVPFDSGLRSNSADNTAARRSAAVDGGSESSQPDCTRYMKLDFSMHAFEHLMGVRDRANLTMVPETSLHKVISGGAETDGVEDIENFGRHITHLLKAEANWTAFNLAALYWREKGSAPAAVECLRRALHVSPHEVKDVALISLANVLHRARLSDEAAIVVHAAIDSAPDNAICHFTLGNIYAVLAEYNKSEICYENTLRLQPEFRSARQRLHAVRCHAKVEVALEKQHNQLQKVLEKLKEYQHRKELYVQLMGQLVDEAIPPLGWDGKECHGDLDGSPSAGRTDASTTTSTTTASSASATRNSAEKDCCSGGVEDEPPGFPFYDNMVDLQFNVKPEDRQHLRQTCEDSQQQEHSKKQQQQQQQQP